MPSGPTALPEPAAVHKRTQIANKLRQMIASMHVGERLPSVTTLQKHFGVANSTIEAAVAALQAEGLVVRRHGSGTFVTGTPPPLTFEPRTRVGRLMITSLANGGSLDIFAAMAAALESEMRRLSYDPILHFDSDPGARIEQARKRWEAREIDGYIHLGSPVGASFPAGVPGVVMGELPEDAAIHQIVVDSYGGGRSMGEYLWSLGHRRIALIALHDLLPAPRRFQGLADVFEEREGKSARADLNFVRVGWKDADGTGLPTLEKALRSLIDSTNPPTAIFCANDQIALPTMLTLSGWGCRVPDDISLVSFDDTPGLANIMRPGLTSLRMPIPALCALAVQTLHQAIDEPGMSFRRLRLPAELIIRESAGPPRQVG